MVSGVDAEVVVPAVMNTDALFRQTSVLVGLRKLARDKYVERCVESDVERRYPGERRSEPLLGDTCCGDDELVAEASGGSQGREDTVDVGTKGVRPAVNVAGSRPNNGSSKQANGVSALSASARMSDDLPTLDGPFNTMTSPSDRP